MSSPIGFCTPRISMMIVAVCLILLSASAVFGDGSAQPAGDETNDRLYFTKEGKPFAGSVINEHGPMVKLDPLTGSCLRLKYWDVGSTLRGFDDKGPCGSAVLTRCPNGEFNTVALTAPETELSPLTRKLREGGIYDWTCMLIAGLLALIPAMVELSHRKMGAKDESGQRAAAINS